MTRLCGIPRVKWLNLMLIQVRERDASVGLGDIVSDLLSRVELLMHIPFS